MVMEEFGQPLQLREFPLPRLKEGEVLVRLEASGICGSDLHMWKGKDPRIPLPIILGHEGVGVIVETRGVSTDVLGRPLQPGDRIIWDRGVPCQMCFYCQIRKNPSNCPQRRVYGVNLSSEEPPHLRGTYAEYICLMPGTKIIRLGGELDPMLYAPAACSGATAARAVERAAIQPGDTVVVQGPGPLGLFAVRLALDRGAGQVFCIGTGRSPHKLNLAREFGASQTFALNEIPFKERLEFLLAQTGGRGADVVIEASGTPDAVREGIRYLARGGRFILPGVATPIGEVAFSIYEEIVTKNIRIEGIWVNDTSHLLQAIRCVERHPHLFARMISHALPLEQANQALKLLEDRQGIKVVLKAGVNDKSLESKRESQ